MENVCKIEFTYQQLKAVSKALHAAKNDQHIGLLPQGCTALKKIDTAIASNTNYLA
ncbi:hypothetical protein [Nostoc phage A1]|nr:hypothetical protein [Nostoc phage A1]